MADSADDSGLGDVTLKLSTEDSDYNLGIDQAQARAVELDEVFDKSQADIVDRAQVAATEYDRIWETTHNNIKSAFSERFQHAGIYLFSRQLLNTVGLGQLAQHAFAAIDMAMTTVAGSFGIAAEALGPVLLAMGVGITVFELFEKGTKKSAKALEEMDAKQADAFKKTDELNQALQKLGSTLGSLPADLKATGQAVADLDAIQRQALEHTKGEQMAAIQAQKAALDAQAESARQYMGQLQAAIAAGREQFGTMADQGRQAQKLALEINDLATKSRALGDQEAILKGEIKSIGEGFDGTADKAKKLAEAHRLAAEAAKKHGEMEAQAAKLADEAARKLFTDQQQKQREYETNEEGLEKKTEQLNDEASESTLNAYQKRQAAAQRFYDDQKRDIDKMYLAELGAANGNAQLEEQAVANKNAAMAALNNAYASKVKANLTDMQAAWKRFGDQAASDVANSAARMIVENASAAQEIKNLSKQAAEQLISDTIRSGIQHAITSKKKAAEDHTASENAIAASTASSKIEMANIASVAAARATADAAQLSAIGAKVAALSTLTAALVGATTAALALDAALAGAA